METRLKQFSLRVMRLVDALPKSTTGRAIANQLVRSGTSIGANYRAAGRGRSTADFIAKLAIAEEEADESVYWIELILEGKLLPKAKVHSLLKEANEILAIICASRVKAKQRRAKK